MPAILTRLLAVPLLCLGLCATHAAHGASGSETAVFGYAVICDEPAIALRLRSGIEARLATLNVGVRQRFPNAKLIIYANRDRNDRRNTEGMSVAIAHVSNTMAAALALDAVQRKQPLPETLQAMLREDGILMHLNVAHLTTASDAEIDRLLDQAVPVFVQKYSGDHGAASPAARP